MSKMNSPNKKLFLLVALAFVVLFASSAMAVQVSVRAKVLNQATNAVLGGASITLSADGYTYPGGTSNSSTGLGIYAGFQSGQTVTINATKTSWTAVPVTRTLASSPTQQTINIYMTQNAATAQVRARILDSSSGAGISGVAVNFVQGSNVYNATATDGSGYSGYVALNAGSSVIVNATKTGYPGTGGTYNVTSSPAQQTVTYNMTAYTPTVQLRVRALLNGSGQEGVTVYVNSQGTNYPVGTTDGQGYTNYLNVYPGSVTITASKPGFTTATQTYNATSSPSSQTASVNMTTSQIVQVRAQVLKSNGTSLEGATVSFTYNGTQYSSGITDNQGYSTFVNLNAGSSISVNVWRDGYSPVTQTYTVSYTPFQQTVNVSMGNSSTVVKARVFDSSTGLAIPNASVSYTFNGATYPGGSTDGEGFATAVTLQQGQTGTITASHSTHQSNTIPYTVTSAAEQTPFINLAQVPTSCGDSSCNGSETQYSCPADCGQVQDTSSYNEGSSITGLPGKNSLAGQTVSVRIDSIVGTGPAPTYSATVTLVDGQGTARVTKTVQAGQYLNQVLTVNGLEAINKTAYVESITVSAATGIGAVRVRITAPTETPSNVTVRARVFDASSAIPVNGAIVSYSFSGSTYPGGTTNDDGYANTVSLVAGQTGTITVSYTGYLTKTLEYTVTSAATQTPFVNLVQGVGVSVRARVFVGVNNPVALQGASVTYIVGNNSYPGGLTDSQGSAGIVTLQPGQTFRVRVEKAGYTTTTSQTFTVLTSNITQVVTVTMAQPTPTTNAAVQARVFDSATGNAVFGAGVTYVFGGVTYPGGTTNNEGFASTVTLQQGQAGTINVSRSGYRVNNYSYTVTTASTQTPFINIVPTNANSVQVRAKVESGGTAVEGARVTYLVGQTSYPGGETTSSGLANTVTLQAGQKFRVKVQKADYEDLTSQEYTVSSGESTYNVTVSIARIPGSNNINLWALVKNASNGQAIEGATVDFSFNNQTVSLGVTNSVGFSDTVSVPLGKTETLSYIKTGSMSKRNPLR